MNVISNSDVVRLDYCNWQNEMYMMYGKEEY